MPGLLDGLSSTEVRSSTVSGTESQFSTGSFAGLRSGQLITPGSVTDTNGRLRSTSVGSPGAFGCLVQAGSFETTAGSTAAVAFRQNFAAANAYVFVAWPQSGLVSALQNAATAGSLAVVTSGTANSGKNTSGANVVGAASFVYDYLAIGA